MASNRDMNSSKAAQLNDKTGRGISQDDRQQEMDTKMTDKTAMQSNKQSQMVKNVSSEYLKTEKARKYREDFNTRNDLAESPS